MRSKIKSWLQMENSNEELDSQLKLIEILVENNEIREALVHVNACREMNPNEQELKDISEIEMDLAIEQHLKKDAD